ncbi:FAD-dependent monooxygenase [Kutzneria sp. CA-103260]|uniref:FAD-dependent monooxygenase n=1 Tax=Kutzneria sp. CA-103260 TaxID=2802641 RepID=UPI001BA52040|nr:FAD-dependent monooxygenase [Kutzneria sp. CA-103260]QUQ71134.1 flavin-type hydroxylase [Kutzneria sp. CA-103260]
MVIVGAGPVGAMLAAELRLQGIGVVVLERLTRPAGLSKANALHARTIQTLDRRGLLARFQPVAGTRPTRGRAQFGGLAVLDRDAVEVDVPMMLGVPQAETERILLDHAIALGADIRRGEEVVGLAEAVVETAAGQRIAAKFVVGADGGRSTVRKLAGIDFAGTDATVAALLGDVTVEDPGAIPFGWHRTDRGWVVGMIRPDGVGRVFAFTFDGPHADRDAPLSLGELQSTVERILGRPVPMRDPRWLSRFGDACRQAVSYRKGQVLLVGDAAHVHFPAGGQGLNLGLQDAVNLGWKLAATINGTAADGLLDTYHAERHPVGERVLRNARAQVVLMDPDPRFDPLRELCTELMLLDETNRHLVSMLAGLDVHYEPGEHPAIGHYAPAWPGLAERLRGGRWVYVGPAPLDGAEWLPGEEQMLIRPDGYVAWAGDAGMTEALRRWVTSFPATTPHR